jgi:hypothetical protein
MSNFERIDLGKLPPVRDFTSNYNYGLPSNPPLLRNHGARDSASAGAANSSVYYNSNAFIGLTNNSPSTNPSISYLEVQNKLQVKNGTTVSILTESQLTIGNSSLTGSLLTLGASPSQLLAANTYLKIQDSTYNTTLASNGFAIVQGTNKSSSGPTYLKVEDSTYNTTIGSNGMSVVSGGTTVVTINQPPSGSATWQAISVCVGGVSKTMYVLGTTPV